MQRERGSEGGVPVAVTDPELENLIKQGEEKAGQMGHALGEWQIGPNTLVGKAQIAQATCIRCKATVIVREKVAPEAQIQGDAIIDTCLPYPAKDV